MNEQTIISDRDQPAPSLEQVLSGVGTDQILCCEFLPEISKWSCVAYASTGHEPTAYGIGESLAAALADLHPPVFLKRARPAGPGEWSTEEVQQ
ncbi:hypothetical protein [Erythrobacter colymbi]|uniref:hypothetical protein n=1 Tax=Erythrobacter colymbi TaxID=1161202 RepID=UPI000A3AC090|nr:hypothetical protein [Erythrobacter colymbi]